MKPNLANVPNTFGCYLWKDINGQVIYVGKSKKLRTRMSQYFLPNQSLKTQMLVKNIASFDYHTTRTEQESFLLEIELIHRYNPKYNIKIKNAGYSPYIVLTNKKERILKIEKRLKRNNDLVFGPFPIEFGPYQLIKILNEIFPFNKCQNPNSNKPCIYYQMNMCLGHCFKTVTEQDYEPYIEKLKGFFRGDTKQVEDLIKQKIETYSSKLNFEQSLKLQKMLKIVQNYANTGKVEFKSQINIDLFAWTLKDNYLSISVTFIRFGKFIRTDNFINKIYPFQTEIEQVEHFIYLFYLQNIVPDEIIFPFELPNQASFTTSPVKIMIPQKGTKKTYMDLTLKDAKKRLDASFIKLNEKEKRYNVFLNFLRTNLSIQEAQTFELIDISSLGETNQVGAVVAFNEANEDKSLYRKYIINLQTTDDYGSIKEVIYRHFRKKMMNKLPFPDVLIIDGGKGQLQAALDILNQLNIKQTVFALKKNNKHQTSTIVAWNDDEFIELDLSKFDFYIKDILARMQDEVHRFVINFNIKRRNQNLFNDSFKNLSFLDNKDIENLYENFETIHQIKNTNEGQLEKVVGKIKAKKIIKSFNKEI